MIVLKCLHLLFYSKDDETTQEESEEIKDKDKSAENNQKHITISTFANERFEEDLNIEAFSKLPEHIKNIENIYLNLAKLQKTKFKNLLNLNNLNDDSKEVFFELKDILRCSKRLQKSN